MAPRPFGLVGPPAPLKLAGKGFFDFWLEVAVVAHGPPFPGDSVSVFFRSTHFQLKYPFRFRFVLVFVFFFFLCPTWFPSLTGSIFGPVFLAEHGPSPPFSEHRCSLRLRLLRASLDVSPLGRSLLPFFPCSPSFPKGTLQAFDFFGLGFFFVAFRGCDFFPFFSWLPKVPASSGVKLCVSLDFDQPQV